MKHLFFILTLWPTLLFSQQKDKGTFSNLDSAFMMPLRVKYLRLDNESIKEITPEIIKFKNLEKLTLSHNPEIVLSDLFTKLSVLPNLHLLNLSYCNIQSIPENISKLDRLEALILSNNKLEALPVEITYLKHLREVIFSQNPKDFRRLPSYQKLKMLELIPKTKFFLVDDYGGEHGRSRLGGKSVRVTKKNLWPVID